jgi:glutathione S-transferase
VSRVHTIYGYQLSYFTRKLEAAFELVELPFRRRSKTVLRARRLERASATRKVPVVVTPDGRVLSDTTPVIDLLDELRPARRLFPIGLDGVVVRLVEEWLDEWFPRAVIHFRWHDPASRAEASRRLAGEALPAVLAPLRGSAARRIAGWGGRACRALGLEEPGQRRLAEADATAVWAALDTQLERTRFALGDRATAVDAVLLGALRGHYLIDEPARRVVEQHPRVIDWAERVAWDGAGRLPPFPECSPFAAAVLDRMAGPYRSWLAAHSGAQDRGERTFSAEIEGRPVEFRVLHAPSPTDSIRYLRDRVSEQVHGDDLTQLRAWLADRGLDKVLVV